VALLQIQGLSKHFGGLMANREIDLEIQEGEIVGLIGPNGAGKTTLFNCIAGYYAPDAGHVFFAGREITAQAPAEICRAGIARTFQLVRVFKNMTALENVMVGAFAGTADSTPARRQALKLLEFGGLADKRDVLASHLTIADKKRLELLRALATRPRLLMLDEAMAGLTPKETADAVDLLRALVQQGLTLFLVEHVMEVIMPISQRIIVLNYGEKIAEGRPAEIAVHPDVVKAYLGKKYAEG
jgi:branched-chain amino acid transport system ATP-binding protein